MKRNRVRFCSLFLALVLLFSCAVPAAFASQGGGRFTGNISTVSAPRFKSSVYQSWVQFFGVLYDASSGAQLLSILDFFPGVSSASALTRDKFIFSLMQSVFSAQAVLGPSGWVRSRSYFDVRRVPINNAWRSNSFIAESVGVAGTGLAWCYKVLTRLLLGQVPSDGTSQKLQFKSKTIPSTEFSNWFESNSYLNQFDSVSFYYLDLSAFSSSAATVYQFDGDLALMSENRGCSLLPYKAAFSGSDPSPSPSPSKPAIDVDANKDKWLKYQAVYGVRGVYQVAMDYNSLVAVCESNDLNPTMYIVPSHNGTQWVIVQGVPAGEDVDSGSWKANSWTEILCDYQGRPYVCGRNSIIDQPLPYDPIPTPTPEPDPSPSPSPSPSPEPSPSPSPTPEPSGDDDNNQKLIDLINQIITLPNGDQYYTENVYYDYDNRAYTTNLYNVTNNEYNTYNYIYVYHINYTSITYIGQTETYEAYRAYYNLPDGRSSDDLTAADLEQLSLVFQDVVPYARSADRLTLRRLFHFDGNTNDSSYWSYIEPGFEWVSGASITYMDAGTFNGALYLDEQAHKFNVNLPNADLSGDFTLQFRLYQSHTVAPSFDSSISAGSLALMKLSGSAVQTGGGTALYDMPVGTWNEIAIMRSGDSIYYYLNGILQTATQAVTGSLGNSFTFDFGSVQQTYKYLDEMRITREALYLDNGSPVNYTPSSVPFDTNLTLVLPDEDVPIADEYVTVVPSDHNLLPFDFVNGAAPSIPTFTPSSIHSFYDWQDYWNALPFGSLVLGSSASLSASPFSLSASGSIVTKYTFKNGDYFWYPDGCLWVDFFEVTSQEPADWPYGKRFFSVVSSSGVASSFVVTVSAPTQSWRKFDVTASSYFEGDFSLSLISPSHPDTYVCYLGSISYWNAGIAIQPVNGSADIVYMELVEGTSPGYTLEYHYATYSPEALKGAPVLAVQSNLVNQSKNDNLYTIGNDVIIGGPRPSYPTRGMVWALVEDGYISSLQQYDGFGWNAVNGRIWTGERWVPYYSYNILTLQDYYDIVGNDYNGNEYIYTESGFWSWFQKAWASFIVKFDKLVTALTGSSTVDETLLPDADPDGVDEDGEPSGGFSFVGLLGNLVSGTWGVVKGLVRIGGNTFTNFVTQLTWIPSGFDVFDPKSTDGIYYVESSPPVGGE